jgi:hypothetical protein
MARARRQASMSPTERTATDLSVVLWRTRRLRQAGFGAQLAGALARDCAYDLHEVLSLVDRGCPPDLAAHILAPLDQRVRRC